MANFLSSGIEPSLIHGVDMEIERVSLTDTVFDPIFNEPVGQGGPQYDARETILAQIHWQQSDELVASTGGDDAQTKGWITMLRSHVDELPKGAFKKGDRIVKVDGNSYEANPLYLVEIRRAAQYRTQKLWKFFFVTRQETTPAVRTGGISGGNVL